MSVNTAKTKMIKSGGTTSEFVQAGVGGIVAIAATFNSSSDSVQIAALACLSLIVCTYTISRAMVKR